MEQNTSFLESMDEEIVNDLINDIAGHLFDEWHDSNCNEGLLYADWKIASMSDSRDIVNAYNEYWELEEDDEYYID